MNLARFCALEDPLSTLVSFLRVLDIFPDLIFALVKQKLSPPSVFPVGEFHLRGPFICAEFIDASD